MAITTFTTPVSTGSTGTTKKGGNTILYLLVGAVVVYLGYKYVIKPAMDKKKAEEGKV